MDQDPSESSESVDECATPIGGTETDGDVRDVLRKDRAMRLDRSSRNLLNRRRERNWNERCEPGFLPCLSLPSAAIGFVAGMGCAILLGILVIAFDTHPSAARDDFPPPCPQDVAVEDDKTSAMEDPAFVSSEGGMDQYAQEQAEKLRHETEQRLAQSEETMILRLDDWRQPLSIFQDMMVEMAGVGTGGGCWVGHEIQRNDLTLETNLLEPYAEELAAKPSAEPSPKPGDQETARQRAKDWQTLWTKFESTAETLRNSPEIDEIWKKHLISTLNEAREAHGSLAVMIGNLEDDLAAQAVIDFCSESLSCTTDMLLDDESKKDQYNGRR